MCYCSERSQGSEKGGVPHQVGGTNANYKAVGGTNDKYKEVGGTNDNYKASPESATKYVMCRCMLNLNEDLFCFSHGLVCIFVYFHKVKKNNNNTFFFSDSKKYISYDRALFEKCY